MFHSLIPLQNVQIFKENELFSIFPSRIICYVFYVYVYDNISEFPKSPNPWNRDGLSWNDGKRVR